jgi:hypothetical protein
MRMLASGGMVAERVIERLRALEARLAVFDLPLASWSFLTAGTDLALVAAPANSSLEPTLESIEAIPPAAASDTTSPPRRREWLELPNEAVPAPTNQPAESIEWKPAMTTERAGSEWQRRLSPDPLVAAAWKRPFHPGHVEAQRQRQASPAIDSPASLPSPATLLETVLLRVERSGSIQPADRSRVNRSPLDRDAGSGSPRFAALPTHAANTPAPLPTTREPEETITLSRFANLPQPDPLDSFRQPFTPPVGGLRRLWEVGRQQVTFRHRAPASEPPVQAPLDQDRSIPEGQGMRRFLPADSRERPLSPAIPGLGRPIARDEEIAQLFADVLRREAERHGIDLDEEST